MRREACQACGSSQPLGWMRSVGNKLLCDACTSKLRTQYKNLRIFKLIDPTVCSGCERDNGDTEYQLISGRPYCTLCREKLYNRPIPQWLKLALVGLLVLLAGALMNSKRYWKAGASLVRGERLMKSHKFKEAAAPLAGVLKVSPDNEEATLLLAKADIMSGNPFEANKLLSNHNGGKFEKGSLADEVFAQMNRVDSAFEKAESARKLEDQGKWTEAARAMRDAANIYPQFPPFDLEAESDEGAGAFEKKDYDRFLSVAEASEKEHPDMPVMASMVASALACKYAVTGDAAFRQKSEQALARARQLTPADPRAQAATKEYEERIRYRLNSQKIIDTDEYNRRFRKGAKTH